MSLKPHSLPPTLPQNNRKRSKRINILCWLWAEGRFQAEQRCALWWQTTLIGTLMPQIRLHHRENLSATPRRAEVIYALISRTVPFLRVRTVCSLAGPYLSFLLWLFLFSISSLPRPSPKKKKKKSIVQIYSEISLDKTPVSSPHWLRAAVALALRDYLAAPTGSCLFGLEVCRD